MKKLLIAALALSMGSLMAYDKVTIHNNTPYDARIKIEYLSCRSDIFSVAAHGAATPEASRGLCRVSRITGKVNNSPEINAQYNGPQFGTSASQFQLNQTGSNAFEITSIE